MPTPAVVLLVGALLAAARSVCGWPRSVRTGSVDDIPGAAASVVGVPGAAAAPLQFRPDGSFQICVFGDLHFGENAWDEWGPRQDTNTVRVINAVLDGEVAASGAPTTTTTTTQTSAIDLVVLNGDLITGENAFLENSTVYLDQIVAPLLRRGLPWASTYGNHDSDFNLSRAALLAHEQRWRPHSRTTAMVYGGGDSGDSDSSDSGGEQHAQREDVGITNYYLPVYGSDCDVVGPADDMVAAKTTADRCTPRLILWFFDSRGGFAFQRRDAATGARVGLANWVDQRVVDWFEATQAALATRYARPGQGQGQAGVAAAVLPSLAFVHIPPNASLTLQTRPGGIDPHREPGTDDDRPLAQQAQGWCADGSQRTDCSYGGQDAPFMQALARAGNGSAVIALVSAHDHGNTWCAPWHYHAAAVQHAAAGLHLCFGQHSGYGGYGSWTRGARQLRFTEDRLAAAAAAPAAPTVGIPPQAQRPAIDTWIRLETGAVVGNVTLNSTYGRHDVYPATPSAHTHPDCSTGRCRPLPAPATTPALAPPLWRQAGAAVGHMLAGWQWQAGGDDVSADPGPQ